MRKHIEENLRESEERFRCLFEHSPYMIIMADENNRIADANLLACMTLGYPPSEIRALSVKDLVEGFDKEKDDKIQKEMFTAGVCQTSALRYKRKDGTAFPVEVAVTFINLRGKQYTLAIVSDITERIRLENEILQISEREQRRIGQDLHDSLSQKLAGMVCMAKALAQKLAVQLPQEAGEATRIVGLLNESLKEVRHLAKGLHPVEVDAGANGLIAALQELALTAQQIHKIPCTFRSGKRGMVVDYVTATHLYRIVQEALTNALKHSHATRIVLSMESTERRIALKIKDNGIGFAPEAFASKGMGLHIMDYRARTIGASLEVKPDVKGGPIVTCLLRQQTERIPS